MSYSAKEEADLNRQLAKWKAKQIRLVKKGLFDNECPLNEYERAVWEKVANAKTYKDVPILAWNMAYTLFERWR